MVITIKLIAISLANTLVLEILLFLMPMNNIFYIFYGHQNIKHVNSVVLISLIDMKGFECH